MTHNPDTHLVIATCNDRCSRCGLYDCGVDYCQCPPLGAEPWVWHPDGPEAHAMLEQIRDEER